MAKKHFAKLPLVLQQVSSQITQLSVVTMQVQLCEWRQFMDHLAKTGAAVLSNGLMAPEDQDHEEEGAPAGSAEKYRRVMGKRQQTTVPQTDARIIRIRSTGQPCKSPPRAALSDSEDDRPLLALGEASRIAAKAKQETPLPALGMHEAAYIQQERQSLRKETIRKDQAVKLFQTAQKEVESANAMHQLLMAQVREAMCRRSACQEALNKAELEVTEHCELIQQSQWDLDCSRETLIQLGDNYASTDGQGHLLDAKKAGGDMPALAERVSVASSARQARMEDLFTAVQEECEALHATLEQLQERHAELTKKSDVAMSELREAKDEVTQKMKALDAAKQTCIEARNVLVRRRVECLTIEGQVVLLQKLVAG